MEGKMRKISVLTLCIVLLACILPIQITQEAKAQVIVTEEWVRRYDGPGNYYDTARAMAIDSSGNIYVTGDGYGNGTACDYVTIKYDPDGNELWRNTYNGPGSRVDNPFDIVLDSSDNVYVTGGSDVFHYNDDFTTIKYDQDGNQLWVAIWPNEQNSLDEIAHKLAVGPTGDIYVTGWSRDKDTGIDYATVAYDPDGNELWVARYNGPNNHHDYARAIATDFSGNVYVTGHSSSNGTGVDYVTVAYDSTGNELWVDRYNGPEDRNDYANAIATDKEGNIYVTGGGQNYTTIAYDSLGNKLWIARYDGDGNSYDQAQALALDPQGNIYVTGGSVGDGSWCDYTTVVYDSTGNELWVARYEGLDNYYNEAREIALDTTGNVYVTGWSQELGYSFDITTIAYDSSGNELWQVNYNGPGNGWDEPFDLILDSSGNIYITGRSEGNGTRYDYVTIKYSQQHPIQATIDIDPDTLNLKSKGKWITCYITLPEGYDVNDIDISTILLEDTIPAEWGDVQGDVLMVKFDRSEVEDLIGGPADEVILTITGELSDGSQFTGSDTIRVIYPP
jgi:uncharacterized delta-60 repeat protein